MYWRPNHASSGSEKSLERIHSHIDSMLRVMNHANSSAYKSYAPGYEFTITKAPAPERAAPVILRHFRRLVESAASRSAKMYLNRGARRVANCNGEPNTEVSIPPPQAMLAIQKRTRVLISLWDSLMFGRVPKNAAGELRLARRTYCRLEAYSLFLSPNKLPAPNDPSCSRATAAWAHTGTVCIRHARPRLRSPGTRNTASSS